MDIIKKLQEEFELKPFQVENTVKLIDEGNTIPFIARYRKEATGSLDDVTLRNFYERLNYLCNLADKKEQVTRSIEEQGKLTDELVKQIEKAETITELEDIYRPFRPKRRTRATIAMEKGLEPFAKILWEQDSKLSPEEIAKDYINPEKEVHTIEDALQGAMDILAEWISDEANYRKYIRRETFSKGLLVTKAKDGDLESVYEMYYDYSEAIRSIPGHRILAINRGEKEKALSVKIEAPIERIEAFLEKQVINNDKSPFADLLKAVIEDSYKRLIAPAIEREIRNELTEKAETRALAVFKSNLSQLLMQPSIKNKVVMGWDPAFRTGCKIAVVDETGKVLDTTVVYPTPPQNKVKEAKEVLKELIKKYNIDIIAIGNGTASRESEMIVSELIKEIDKEVHYIIVNEAGASVYSASPLGSEEFPQYDVGIRSAASIARRLQDPLAELVKIDPKSIGVGQYQHDMNQKRLEEALNGVVEDCVNRVGVDLNTASVSLLQYVAGIRNTVAKNIVEYRETNGKFTTRKQLLEVKKLGPKVFEQCAGFLRIPESDNGLDRTGVHPESYKAAKALLKYLGYTEKDILESKIKNIREQIEDINILAEELEIGVPTLEDIIKELEKPGRDPREDMPKPILRSDVLELEDLKPGMVLMGTVRNITDFGAFVDIGVHQDGLVHISEMSDRFIKHPLEAVSVGDIIKVSVLSVDINKKRIALTMKGI
ncbi:MAG: RNA-binding transcriptional accessory protein [Epulopiscium sp.]|nr:RNA-binding transcriptional accessory protein [Candidatus Epulonipiscium sp.]